jgi:hydrogenase nickel incorporation protein HypA/HybF
MHEYILADRILQSLLKDMKSQGLAKVSEVHVELGELRALENDTLRSAFATLSKGTPAETCKLKLRRIKASVICAKCGYEGGLSTAHEHVIDPVFACPKCGEPVSIKAGNELRITKIV